MTTTKLNTQLLKDCRARKGWSLLRAADELGVTLQTLISLETGKHQPRASTLHRIATVYGEEMSRFYETVSAT